MHIVVSRRWASRRQHSRAHGHTCDGRQIWIKFEAVFHILMNATSELSFAWVSIRFLDDEHMMRFCFPPSQTHFLFSFFRMRVSITLFQNWCPLAPASHNWFKSATPIFIRIFWLRPREPNQGNSMGMLEYAHPCRRCVRLTVIKLVDCNVILFYPT